MGRPPRRGLPWGVAEAEAAAQAGPRSASAVDRVRPDRMGLDQRISIAIHEVCRWVGGSETRSPFGGCLRTRESMATRPPTSERRLRQRGPPQAMTHLSLRDEAVAHDKKGDRGRITGHPKLDC